MERHKDNYPMTNWENVEENIWEEYFEDEAEKEADELARLWAIETDGAS